MAWATNTVLWDNSVNVPRASLQAGVTDDAPVGTIKSGFTVMTAGTVSMRATLDEAPPSPPPPPPPPGLPHYGHAIIGQSNALNFGTGQGAVTFRNRFLELVPNCTAQTISCGVGSSNIEAWAVGGTIFNAAVANWNAAKAANPNFAPGSLIHIHGENDSTTAPQAVRFDERCLAVHAGFRAAVNAPALPVVVVELFKNPNDGRPYWDVVQKQQREMSWQFSGGVWTLRPGYAFASWADLAGGNLHPPESDHIILGNRIAEALDPAFP